MNELYNSVLNRVDIGIIILDCEQRIIFWNDYSMKISGIDSITAHNRKIAEVVPVFEKSLFSSAMIDVIKNNQSRFFSGKIHKAFLFPKNIGELELRQNMKIEPMSFDDNIYVLIQISDITHEINKERRLISFISELKKDYEEVKEQGKH